MADESILINTADPAEPTAKVAADKVGDIYYQRYKPDIGGDGASIPVSAANPMPVGLDATSLAALENISADVAGPDIGALTETAPATDTAARASTVACNVSRSGSPH